MRFAILLLFFCSSVASARPVVSVTGGQIRGQTFLDGSSIFQGVPFARAPVGALRWRAPQPLAHWRGIRDASAMAPACMQANPSWTAPGTENQSEDCLYLEVRTPNLRPPKALPVMVWIHGGGNAAGSLKDVVLSSMVNRGLVLVAIQYRLGPFGYISHPALTAEGNSGNFGLQDQQAALQWVKSNVAAFGGDPENITLFGGSAGSQAVGLMMVRPEARGLFHKAIMQSGTPGFGAPLRTLADNEATGRAIAAQAGLRAETAAALRDLAADVLVSATVAHLGSDAGMFWARPVLDGKLLREEPRAVFARGGQAPVPLLIGTIAHELTNPAIAADPEGTIKLVSGPNEAGVRAHYGLAPGRSPLPQSIRGQLALRLSTDLMFRCPTAALARDQARLGVPVWQYRFDYRLPGGPPVRHFAEMRYVFNAAGEGRIPADAPPLMQYWVNFAKTGNPNGPGLVGWPAVHADGDDYLAISNAGQQPASDIPDLVCNAANEHENYQD